MLKNYFKVAIRNILRHKVYSTVNILGLSIGMSAFILISLLVQYEESWDDFHVDKERIYRVQQLVEFNEQTQEWTQTVFPLAGELRDHYPEFEQTTVLREVWGELMTSDGEKNFKENHGFYIEPQFFDIFNVIFTKGSADQAIKHTNSIVLTEDAAQKYFPDENPMGKTIKSSVNGVLLVTGVIKKWPENAHMRPEYLVSFESMGNSSDWDFRNDWGSTAFRNYVKLNDGVNVAIVNSKIRDILDDKVEENNKRQYLRPLADLHTTPTEASKRDTPMPYYKAVAFFVLLLAAINYINLTTAKSSQREKEIGIRKVVGGNRFTLFNQFIGESLLLSMAALVLAFFVAELLLPVFNTIMNRNLSIGYLNNIEFVVSMVGIMITVGIISGLYPALYLSSFNPIRILRGNLNASGKKSRGNLRRLLVGVQAVISLILIISTFFIYQQVNFMKNKDLGLSTKNLVYCEIPSNDNPKLFEDLRTRLLTNPNVVDASICSSTPFMTYNRREVNWEGADPNEKIHSNINQIGYSFAHTFGLKLKEGRLFSNEYSTEDTKCIVNQTFVKTVGWDNPIGKTVQDGKYTVVGVVEDFHISSVHNKIAPYLMTLHNLQLNQHNEFAIKITDFHRDETIAHLNITLKDFFPDKIFNLTSFEEELDLSAYAVWEGVRDTFGYFTLITLVIAIIGVVGLISFSIQRKTKEIGIRKVLGASLPGIYKLINNDFLIIQFIAILIAYPLAYLLINTMPGAYKYDMGLLGYMVPAIVMLFLSIASTAVISIKAALANPSDSLRSE